MAEEMHRGKNRDSFREDRGIFSAYGRDRRTAVIGLRLFILALLFLLVTGPAKAQNRPVKASAEEIRLAGTLKERLDEVNARAQELDQREEDLDALQEEIDKKMQQLAELQKDVEQKLTELKAIKDSRFKKLIKVYSAMSASKLAPLLDKMGDDSVAEILRAMQPEDVAKILPKMAKDKAVRVSRIMGLIK